ncbi:hypothetical protein [Akkermansia sp.]|nr:hypothetical protein [Akkermansia sp.]MEE0764439.1 hypothetical protein [Akkermansia sp.]
MSISSSTHPTRQEQLASMREFSNNTNARLTLLDQAAHRKDLFPKTS